MKISSILFVIGFALETAGTMLAIESKPKEKKSAIQEPGEEQ